MDRERKVTMYDPCGLNRNSPRGELNGKLNTYTTQVVGHNALMSGVEKGISRSIYAYMDDKLQPSSSTVIQLKQL